MTAPGQDQLLSENRQLEAALDQSAQEVRRLVEDLHRLEDVRGAALAAVTAWQEGRPLDQPLALLAAALVREGLVRKN